LREAQYVFLDRERELLLLSNLLKKRSASLAICKGRRRIGKSTLIQRFGKQAKTFLEFQGLPPREGITNQDQLDAFAEQISAQTTLPGLSLSGWSQAFSLLATVIRNESTVVLLDEISWMSGKDKDFAGQLKIAWDTKFKKFPKLILIACGSVSSWIDKNILGSTGFMGRVSLELQLFELPLHDCNRFWKGKASRVSSFEKLKILSVTGGVPRYLEEVDITLSAEENIKRLCFTREGILFSEFDRIFDDVFSKRASCYKQIVSTLVSGPRTISEICEALDRDRSGHVSEYVKDLVASGFVGQDFSYPPGSSRHSRTSRFRLRDNYLRFYLKYIEPAKTRIQQGLTDDMSVESIVNWDVIMGFQFENLVLNSLVPLCKVLSIRMNAVRSASPFSQKATQRQRACQIDLLIQTKHTLYICEVKFRRKIRKRVITEVQEKIARLKKPRTMSVRPVLIYEGELDPAVEDEDFFDKCIPFGDLLTTATE
jgi:AAA+ ATPase superfamily predicted ATPase